MVNISHLLYWYSFKHFLENQARTGNANMHIRRLLYTEKRMVQKDLARKKTIRPKITPRLTLV